MVARTVCTFGLRLVFHLAFFSFVAFPASSASGWLSASLLAMIPALTVIAPQRRPDVVAGSKSFFVNKHECWRLFVVGQDDGCCGLALSVNPLENPSRCYCFCILGY